MFNNDASDSSFGVTEPIVLDELSPYTGRLVNAVTVPDDPARGDYLTTSFSSKSELAINQSTDGQYDTFVGYVAPPGAIDASNANTPGEIDPTIADSATPTYRAVAQIEQVGPVRVHRDQRLQRRQRPGRDPRPRGRPARHHLRGG